MIRSVESKVEFGDWLDEKATIAIRADRIFGRITRRFPNAVAPFAGALLALRRRYAGQRLAVGVELLSRGSIVAADRLHAHILCCLLDIPNIAFDSYDGKVSALYETWTHKAVNARICTDISNLANVLREVDPANA